MLARLPGVQHICATPSAQATNGSLSWLYESDDGVYVVVARVRDFVFELSSVTTGKAVGPAVGSTPSGAPRLLSTQPVRDLYDDPTHLTNAA